MKSLKRQRQRGNNEQNWDNNAAHLPFAFFFIDASQPQIVFHGTQMVADSK